MKNKRANELLKQIRALDRQANRKLTKIERERKIQLVIEYVRSLVRKVTHLFF